MMRRFTFLLMVLLIFYSCNSSRDTKKIEKWKQEIRQTELDFSKLAQEKGIYKAFTTYAANDAVVRRNEKLILGIKNIEEFYQNKNSKGLSWKPDFVDVSASGDLGYTYGHYTYAFTDSTGNVVQETGIFHTVWKKQPDGSWRFVWD